MAEHKLARTAGMISLATMLSRVLGLVRETLFAALLGASKFADAFVVAFRIPNLLRDLFAEGALSQAFVPTFKQKLKHDGADRAYLLANRLAGTLFVVIGAIVLVAALFAPTIVSGLARGFDDADKFDVTVTLTRIMLPFLPVISLAAVAMGMLNSQDHYGAPALAPAVFNVVSIVVGTVLYLAGVEGRWVAIGWSVGTVLGGVFQLGIQIPVLWRLGYRAKLGFDLMLKDPGMRRIGKLMLPAVAGLAAVQINIVVNTIFASSEDGANAWLNYAFRLMQLPIGVFGVAIATVSTTRYADSAADNDREKMGRQFVESLRLVMFLTVPATVGLILVGEPIIRLIFERGQFAASDTVATTAALELYATGLVAYSSVKVAAPAFYALDKARVPIIGSVMAVVGNLTINFTLHKHFGYRILAFGVAAGAVLNFATLYVFFHRHITKIPHGKLLAYLVKVGVAAGVMGVTVWGSYKGISRAIGIGGLWRNALAGLSPVIVGGVVYAVACKILRIEELGHYTRRIKRH